MCRPCICRAILALLIIVLAWWQVGFNQILITVFALILFVMALAGNVCCCSGYKREKKQGPKQAVSTSMPITMETAKKPAKRPAARKKPARKR